MEPVTRSGMKTSEFLGMVMVFVAVLGNGTPYLEISDGHITLLAGLAAAYGGGRTLLKNTLAKNGGSA